MASDDPDVDEPEADEPEMVAGEPVTPPSDGSESESEDSGLATVVVIGLLAVAAALLGGDDSDQNVR